MVPCTILTQSCVNILQRNTQQRSVYLFPQPLSASATSMLNDAAMRIPSVSTSTYVNTSTNQEELRDELILSEDHSERPAYSYRNSNYRSDHPDNKRSISDYLMSMNGCLIGWCC